MNYFTIPGLKKEPERDYWQRADIPKSEKMMEVCIIVSNYFRFPLNEMFGKYRSDEFVIRRALAIYFIKRLVPLCSLVEIGKLFGGRDHTSVRHANLTLKDWFCSDDGALKKHHLYLCEKLKIDATEDWDLSVLESKQNKTQFQKKNKVIKTNRFNKKQERNAMKRPVGRPKGAKNKKPKEVELKVVVPEKIIRFRQKVYVRPTSIYTNTNHEQALEDKVRAFAI